jgi:hypothetical protein
MLLDKAYHNRGQTVNFKALLTGLSPLIDIVYYDTYTRPMKLFINGLVIFAIGIGTLVYGLNAVYETSVQLFGMPISKQGVPLFIGVGAGLSALGFGMIIGSIMWKRKQ